MSNNSLDIYSIRDIDSYNTLNIEAHISLLDDYDEDEDDDQTILLNIHYKNDTEILVINEATDDDISHESTNQNLIDETLTKHFDRSQLTHPENSWPVLTSAFTTLVEDLVPEAWVEDTAMRLTLVARKLGPYLDNYKRFEVDIEVETLTVFNPYESSGSCLLDHFVHESRGLSARLLDGGGQRRHYVRWGPRPFSAVAVNEIEDDEVCAICREDLIQNDDSEIQEVLMLPCSHMFHSYCICKWVKEKCECPLCRLNLSKKHLVIVNKPVIHHPS